MHFAARIVHCAQLSAISETLAPYPGLVALQTSIITYVERHQSPEMTYPTRKRVG